MEVQSFLSKLRLFVGESSIYEVIDEIIQYVRLEHPEPLQEQVLLFLLDKCKWIKQNTYSNKRVVSKLLELKYVFTEQTVAKYLTYECNPICICVMLLEAGAKIPPKCNFNIQLAIYAMRYGHQLSTSDINKIKSTIVIVSQSDIEINRFMIKQKYLDNRKGLNIPLYFLRYNKMSYSELCNAFGGVDDIIKWFYSVNSIQAVEKFMLTWSVSPTQSILSRTLTSGDVKHLLFMLGFRIPVLADTCVNSYSLWGLPTSKLEPILKVLCQHGTKITSLMFNRMLMAQINLIPEFESYITVDDMYECLYNKSTSLHVNVENYITYLESRIEPIRVLRLMCKTHSSKNSVISFMKKHKVVFDRECVANIDVKYNRELYNYVTDALKCTPPVCTIVNNCQVLSGSEISEILKQHNLLETPKQLAQPYSHIKIARL